MAPQIGKMIDALIADAPLDTVDDAERLITLLVDLTDPNDKIGTALSMLVTDRDAWKRRGTIGYRCLRCGHVVSEQP